MEAIPIAPHIVCSADTHVRIVGPRNGRGGERGSWAVCEVRLSVVGAAGEGLEAKKFFILVFVERIVFGEIVTFYPPFYLPRDV